MTQYAPYIVSAIFMLLTVLVIAPSLVGMFKDPKPMNPDNYIKNAYGDK